MTALTKNHAWHDVSDVHSYSIIDVAADANEIFTAAFVQRTAGGYAVVVGDTGGLGEGPVIGVNRYNVPDQTGNADGDAQARVYQGQFERPIDGTTPVTDADMFEVVYAANNFDVTSDSSKPVLGVMVGINNDAGTCTVLISGSANVALSPLTTLATGHVPLPLNGFYLNDGTPLAAFADGASPTPGLSLNDSEAAGIRWNNDATPGQIVTSFSLPADMDVGAPSAVVLLASKVGATAADQPTFGVGVFEQQVGVAYDAGSDLGGATNEINADHDGDTKEVQQLQLTIAADSFSTPADGSTDNPAGTFDLLDADRSVTLTLQPEAGELATDDLILHSARLVYERIT